jgi:hypothetical protein
MTDENHQRHIAPVRGDEEEGLVADVLGDEFSWYEVQEVLADRILVPAHGWDVDQLERPGGEAIGERVHSADTIRRATSKRHRVHGIILA